MARITPKTNWVAHNIPVATDFNRIESNNRQAFDEIDGLGSALGSEEAARIAADNNLQSNINAEASTRSSSDSSLQTQINARATKAVIGDNGGVGSVVSVTSTYAQITPEVKTHTWAMPHSGVWLFVNPPIGMPSIFSGSSTSRETTSGIGPASCQFWRIG